MEQIASLRASPSLLTTRAATPQSDQDRRHARLVRPSRRLAPPLPLRSRPSAFAGSPCACPLPPVQLPRSATGAAAAKQRPMTTNTVGPAIKPRCASRAKTPQRLAPRKIITPLTTCPRSVIGFHGALQQRSRGMLVVIIVQANRVTVLPNNSFKLSPNGMSCRPSSAGPAAHFSLAVQHVTPSAPAYLKR